MSDSIHFDAEPRLARNKANSVRIVVDFDKPTKVRGIHATFHGAERTEATYRVTTTDSKGNARVKTRTAVEYSDIVKDSFLLFGDAQKGFFSRLGDSFATWIGGGKHEFIEAGQKEFVIDLKVSDRSPASFKGTKCKVFYRLEVKVDLPIRIDWSNTHPLF